MSLKTDAFGKLAELPANASKSGATFTGWYTAATGGTEITTNYVFERDMTIYAQYSSNGAVSPAEPPVLTAEGDNENNLVKLSWTSSRAGQEYYMVYQRDTGGNGLDEFQSIPLKKDIKVLNVYPDIAGGSDGLQSWMQDYGNPSGYTMQVDKVAISDFNGTDITNNYAHYLTRDSNGAYAYDVLYFGAWDANNRRDLSDEAHAAVEGFIEYGGGVLVGHDTASFNHYNFIDLAQKYLNMEINFQEGQGDPSFPPYGSSQVAIERRGFPMNYPYALGNVGDVLITPVSHSYYQFAKGDVWFKFNNLEWGSGPEITSYDGRAGTNNFYLTTWNNVAMIQTGHSNGAATVDEQKILANTLFYLAQVSTANSFEDRMSQDVAAPDAVTGQIVVSAGSSAGKQNIQWNEAQDNGNSYAYYLKAVSFVDGSSYNSTEAVATVTTGVQGYAVKIDTDSSTVDPGNTVTTSTASYETGNLQAGVTYYAHIRAIDKAGNPSSVYTVPFTIDATGLTVTATDPSGKENDGKTKLAIAETVGQGNKLLYINVGEGALTAPGVGEQLSEQSGYQQLPADGLIEAVNGDLVGVVEVDADGKVVRFGQTTAISFPTPDELVLTSVDPGGVMNNGKTIISAQAESGNSLVYVNFGSEQFLPPYKGELLAGYTDLPADGIIPAAHNDQIAVAELDASGRVVRFAVVSAKVIAASEEPGNNVPGEVNVPGKPATRGVEVLVNGKVEYAGIATLSSDQGQTLTTIDVDQAKLQAKLDAEGTGAVVTIPWTEQSDIVVGKLTGQMIKNMEDKEATLVLATATGAYKIPTEQIQIAALASQFGENVKLEDVQLEIRIALVAPEAAKAAESTVTGRGVTLMAIPVSFTVKAQYDGVSIEIIDYSVYVERTVALPAHVDPNKITTGVVVEPDGTLRHVPTKVTRENETYYAEINSLTNSDYAVIWNPVKFNDVAGHWSEAAVNDMGSRLVVNGIGGGKYNPDANITRAEFAAIIVRGLGLRLDQGTVPFNDISGSEWYASVVNTAFKFQLITGYEDGSFRPQGKITRQEAMTIIARAMKITGLSKQWAGLDMNQLQTLEVFRDAEAVSNWAKEGATLSVAAQIVNGRAADMLKPGAFVTRAEVAAMVQRLLQKSQLI